MARMAMGIRLSAAGMGKLVFLPKLEMMLHEMGLPNLNIAAVAFSLCELTAGICCAIGWHTRKAAAFLIFALGVYALLDLYQHHQWLLRRDVAFDLSVYVILLFWILVSGPGRYAVDSNFDKVKFLLSKARIAFE
jgi:uncharacterized membrane protein YphA (DoxX/SURF4 family)